MDQADEPGCKDGIWKKSRMVNDRDHRWILGITV